MKKEKEVFMAKVVINREKCKGCELCIQICPQKILVMSKSFNKKSYHPAEQINPEKCTGCAFCAMTCPEVAIEVYK
jgi:2-oxoglutarate ferredoxin oxidoreductase subunit delta